jgi:hypothetical protein
MTMTLDGVEQLIAALERAPSIVPLIRQIVHLFPKS